MIYIKGTYCWKGKKRDTNQGEGGSNQTAFPRFGGLVSVANSGQCDLRTEEFRHEVPRKGTSVMYQLRSTSDPLYLLTTLSPFIMRFPWEKSTKL